MNEHLKKAIKEYPTGTKIIAVSDGKIYTTSSTPILLLEGIYSNCEECKNGVWLYKNNNWCNKFNHQFEEFKVGDWVVITSTLINKYYNCSFQIEEVIDNDGYNYVINEINWSNNHFRKALPHEIPQDFKLTLLEPWNLPVTNVLNNDFKIISNIPLNSNISLQDWISNMSVGVELIQNPYQKVNSPSLQDVISVTKQKGLIVRTIEPKQVKQEIKLVPIKLNNHSRLKLK
jgi:hypothetical protein